MTAELEPSDPPSKPGDPSAFYRIPINVPRSLLNEISQRSGLAVAEFNTLTIRARPENKPSDVLTENGLAGAEVYFPPERKDYKFEILPAVRSMTAEPGGLRHIVGEIRWRFLRVPAGPPFEYRAIFDMHMAVKPIPATNGWDPVSAIITWKGEPS